MREEIDKFLECFTVSDGENILPVNELGHQLGKYVLEQRLADAHRTLNNYQVCIVRVLVSQKSRVAC